MKKLFLIFGIVFAFGVTAVAQEKIDKDILTEITQQVAGEDTSIIIKQTKITDEIFYWETIINNKLYLAILKASDYEEGKYSNLELFELKRGSSIMINYIKYYHYMKNQKIALN